MALILLCNKSHSKLIQHFMAVTVHDRLNQVLYEFFYPQEINQKCNQCGEKGGSLCCCFHFIESRGLEGSQWSLQLQKIITSFIYTLNFFLLCILFSKRHNFSIQNTKNDHDCDIIFLFFFSNTGLYGTACRADYICMHTPNTKLHPVCEAQRAPLC